MTAFYMKYSTGLNWINWDKKSSDFNSNHCVKSPVFGIILVHIFRHSVWVSLCIQSECGKIRTRITPNTDTFHAVNTKRIKWILVSFYSSWSQKKTMGFLMISGRIEINWFARIRLILEAEFADDLLVIWVTRNFRKLSG